MLSSIKHSGGSAVFTFHESSTTAKQTKVYRFCVLLISSTILMPKWYVRFSERLCTFCIKHSYLCMPNAVKWTTDSCKMHAHFCTLNCHHLRWNLLDQHRRSWDRRSSCYVDYVSNLDSSFTDSRLRTIRKHLGDIYIYKHGRYAPSTVRLIKAHEKETGNTDPFILSVLQKFERFRKGLDGFEVDSSPLTSKPVVPDRPKYSTGIIYDKVNRDFHLFHQKNLS